MIDGLDSVIRTLNTKLFDKATNSALNKIAQQGITAGSKAVREVYNIKARDLKAKIVRIKAKNGKAEVIVRGDLISLHYFGGKQQVVNKNGRKYLGATVKVKKTGGRKLVNGAFIATMPNGGNGIFKRKDKAKTISRNQRDSKGRPKRNRLPIERLHSIKYVNMFNALGVKEIEKIFEEKFGTVFIKELGWLLEK